MPLILIAGLSVLNASSGYGFDERPLVISSDVEVVAAPVSVSPMPVSAEVPMPAPSAAGTPTPPVAGMNPADNTAGSASGQNANPQPVVIRPPAAQYVPLPVEQEIRQNPDGKVTFSIRSQPWEPVLQWLADASSLSFDWQELPGDSLNLLTSREYTMEEARDLINRHLLSRGYTLIVHGEIMSVVKTKDLNPALVQRVSPQQLSGLPDHTIVKVSFDLDWLIADEAVEELKPMLSSAGKIHKLSRTNRLEVIDTALSLRQLWELIEAEQSNDGQEQLVRAFRLKHRRAEDVIRMLRELLKLQDSAHGASGPDGPGGSMMDPNMAMQMMQQVQQQVQQMQMAAGQSGGASAARTKTETRLVLNQRENMILAQAEPDKMAVVEKAIAQIDVPREAENSLLRNINRMKIYRLESVEPQSLVDVLQQLGDLDPGTVLKVDKPKRSIIAWATLADHLTISTLVERMDQSSRRIEVIPLRRLDAEYVAGTIRLLMGKEEEKEQPQFPRWGYFGPDMSGQQTAKEPSFRVEADTENNRLLVNANAIEMDEIRDLLIKLGELMDPESANDRVRVFDLNPDEDLQRFRDQIELHWRRANQLEFDLRVPAGSRRGGRTPDAPQNAPRSSVDPASAEQDLLSDRRLPAVTNAVRIWTPRSKAGRVIPPGHAQPAHATASDALRRLLDEDRIERQRKRQLNDQFTVTAADSVEERSDSSVETAIEPQVEDLSGSGDGDDVPQISRDLFERLRQELRSLEGRRGADPDRPRTQDDSNSPDESLPLEHSEHPPGTMSPVRISVTQDGRLIVHCADPAALMEIEDLISQVAAPRRSFRVFHLKYATPSWVALNLKDFFKADEETRSALEYDPYWGIVPTQKKSKGPRTLSRKSQPQFISDNFTSTILVRDADTRQLRTIEDLIAIYDVPEPSDSRSMRVTTIFRLEHARAASVASAVKDVFRDLLSSNDRALDSEEGKGSRQGNPGMVTFLRGAPPANGDKEEEPIRFKGLLSIGIDESSNTLIISSAGSLMDTITEMVEALDKAADSSSVVQVIRIDSSVDIAVIQERLKELMKSEQRQPGQNAVAPGQMMPGQPALPGQSLPTSGN